MSRLIRFMASASAAAAMVGVMAVSASAAAPAASNGSGGFVVQVTSVRTADGNTILGISFQGTVNGTFTGTWSETGTEVLHPDGTVTANASGTFHVSVSGCGTTTFQFSLAGQGVVNGPISGQFRSIDEASATAAIHTVDDFQTTGLASFVYSGMYSC
jgi:hypothetical protein